MLGVKSKQYKLVDKILNMKNKNVTSILENYKFNIPKTGGVTITNLGEILHGFLTLKIIPYDNNRGGKNITVASVKNIINNFHVYSLGQVSVIYDNNTPNFVSMTDWHHRRIAILHKLTSNNTFTKAELQYPISVQTVTSEKGYELYSDINQCKKHTSADQITNIDLALGGLIYDVLAPNIEGFKTYIDCSKKINNFAYILYLFSTNVKPKDFGFPMAFKCRKKVQDMRGLTKLQMKQKHPEINLNFNPSKLYEATTYYRRLMEELQNHTDYKAQVAAGVGLKDIVASGPLMGVILSCVISNSGFTKPKPKTLANRIMKHQHRVIKLITQLTNSKGYIIEDTQRSLFTTLSS